MAPQLKPEQGRTYIIQPGDQLGRIAWQAGLRGNYLAIWLHPANEDLRRSGSPDRIFPGQSIYIPTANEAALPSARVAAGPGGPPSSPGRPLSAAAPQPSPAARAGGGAAQLASRAQQALNSGRLAEARQLFWQAAHAAGTGPEKGRLLVKAAEVALQQGNPEAARVLLTSAQAHVPELAQSLLAKLPAAAKPVLVEDSRTQV